MHITGEIVRFQVDRPPSLRFLFYSPSYHDRSVYSFMQHTIPSVLHHFTIYTCSLWLLLGSCSYLSSLPSSTQWFSALCLLGRIIPTRVYAPFPKSTWDLIFIGILPCLYESGEIWDQAGEHPLYGLHQCNPCGRESVSGNGLHRAFRDDGWGLG